MAYMMKKEESHVSVEHCFECKEAFILTPEHQDNYIASSLCPKCFNNAMEQLHSTDIEDLIIKIIRQLDEIGNQITEINNELKKIAEG